MTGILKTGPFAWDGVLSFYFRNFCWLLWFALASVYMILEVARRRQAIDSHRRPHRHGWRTPDAMPGPISIGAARTGTPPTRTRFPLSAAARSSASPRRLPGDRDVWIYYAELCAFGLFFVATWSTAATGGSLQCLAARSRSVTGRSQYNLLLTSSWAVAAAPRARGWAVSWPFPLSGIRHRARLAFMSSSTSSTGQNSTAGITNLDRHVLHVLFLLDGNST